MLSTLKSEAYLSFLSQSCHFALNPLDPHCNSASISIPSQKWERLLGNDNSDLDLGVDKKNYRPHSMRFEIRLVSSSQKVEK